MGFKTGFVLGAAAGYLLGSRAGRERYDQIKGWVSSAAGSGPARTLVEKGKAVADMASEHMPGPLAERLHAVSERLGDSAAPPGDEA